MYQITTATSHDVPLIQELTNLIWPGTYQSILTQAQIDYMIAEMYSTAALNKQLENGITFLLLWDGDQAIGFAGFGAESAGVYKLHKLYLHPAYQGKGAGKFLLHTVISHVTVAGGQVLELNVNRYNKARYFYEKIGFEICEEKDINIGNGYWMNDFVMRKVL